MKTLRQDMERSSSSANAHFRIKLLQAAAQLQVSFIYFTAIDSTGFRAFTPHMTFFSNDWPILLFVFFSFYPSKPRDVWFHWRRALWACKIWVSFTISHWKTAKGPWWYRLPVIWPILRLSRRHWISSGYHFRNFNSDEWWQTKRVQPAISY